MIEVATGVAFLLSSLYGAGQVQAQTVAVAAAVPTTEQVTTTADVRLDELASTSHMTDSKDIEKYVGEQYADEPILVEIARCESTFRQYGPDGQVIRGLVNPQDVGVMQINERYHADEAAKLGLNLNTVAGNVAFAKRLYNKFGTDPWVSSSKCWTEGIALK